MLTFVANTVLFILTGVIIAKTTNESTLKGTLNASDKGHSLIVYFEVYILPGDYAPVFPS